MASPTSDTMPQTKLTDDNNVFTAHLQAGQPETEHVGTGFAGHPRMAVARTIGLQDLSASHGFVAVASRDIDAVYASWRFMTSVLFGLWLTVASLATWGLARYQKSAARLRDIADKAEHDMRYSNERFEQLAQTIPCVLYDFEVSASGKVTVTYVSPYIQTLVGITPEAFLADYSQLTRRIPEEDRAVFLDAIANAISHGMAFEFEFRLQAPSGVMRWVRSTATAGASAKGAAVTHFSGFIFDITDTKNQQLQLRDMAYQDPLTQADNRRSFIEKLLAEIARVQRYGEQASLLMVDIDFFKQVNDTYGHLVGDVALKHLVAVLQTGLRGLDSLGRLGGEEFAVLLPDTDLEAATQLAERLRLAVQASPVIEAGQTVPFTISIGVVAITADTPDMKTVLHMADKAMYHAKQTGRNRVCTAAEAPDTTLQSALD